MFVKERSYALAMGLTWETNIMYTWRLWPWFLVWRTVPRKFHWRMKLLDRNMSCGSSSDGTKTWFLNLEGIMDLIVRLLQCHYYRLKFLQYLIHNKDTRWLIHQNAFDAKGCWSILFIVVRSYFRNSRYKKWLGRCPMKLRITCLCLHTWLWQGLVA